MNQNQYSVKDLTLKEKIGQLFLIGFHGEDGKADSEIAQIVKEQKPGGVILFDKDMVHHKPVHNIKSPEQVRELTSQLQSFSDIPLIISVDQEGGLINRLKPEYGFPATRSHAELGKIDDTSETQSEGELISSMLKKAGINTNFAPCVDLALNLKSSIIAKRERCFGNSSEKVTKHARAYVEGHEKNGIITACKHFPGHGSAEGDTHAGFVDVSSTWQEDEIKPYQSMISEDLCPVIMTSHIFNDHFDDTYPATLSKKTIQQHLREEMNYDGVVVSDDMQMKAISDHYGLEESLRLGIEAGIDIFCFGNNLLKEQIDLQECISIVENFIEKDIISESRLDESVERILKLKNEYLQD